jgi:hypothetical protein
MLIILGRSGRLLPSALIDQIFPLPFACPDAFSAWYNPCPPRLLDFILNHDIKYRMGQDAAGEEDDE